MKCLVVVPFYNRPDLLALCLSSIEAQDCPDVHVVVADDGSTEEGVKALLNLYRERDGWTWLRHRKNLGATRNIVEAIRHHETHADFTADDVIVIVDGDDRLAHDGALTALLSAHRHGALVVYGGYASEPFDPGCHPARPIPADVLRHGLIRAYCRDVEMPFNHPLSFRRRVFDVLRDEDFQIDGEWMGPGYDVTFMSPMIEAAGERVVCLDEILYIYNSANPASVMYTQGDRTRAENQYVVTQPRKYQPVDLYEEETCAVP